MLSYECEENLITKNDNGNLHGEVQCPVCLKKYSWEDNKNSQAILERISIDGDRVFLEMNIIGKCPHCNYKTKFTKWERNDSIRY